MNIYINDVLIKSEILSVDTPTLDETLETFSFALISNDAPTPFAPMQSVQIVLDNNDTINFILVSDNVDIFSAYPLRYKHSITCVQNTRKLSKYLVRDSVFAQPAYKYKDGYNAGSMQYFNAGGTSGWRNDWRSSNPNASSESLILAKNEKIKNAFIEIDFQYIWAAQATGGTYVYRFQSNAKNILDITDGVTIITAMTGLYFEDLILQYKDSNNVTQQETLAPEDFGMVADWRINKKFECPRIKELADQGANNFEILFQDSAFFNYTSDSGVGGGGSYIVRWSCQIKIIAEVYYYTVYDILNLLDIRYKQINGYGERDSIFTLPTNVSNPELYELLTTTIAPNFTFTQLTMYECVAEVFRLFDAIFTMDENGELGIEYFNNLKNTALDSPKLTGQNAAIGEDKFTNGLVAYYQDAHTEEQFPSNNTFAHLRSGELGVPEADDFNLVTPHPISNIIKVEVLLKRATVIVDTLGISQTYDINYPLDITRYVIEESVWTNLDAGVMTDTDINNRTIKQANTLYFTKGDNKIKCAYSLKPSWGVTYYAFNSMLKCAFIRWLGDNLISSGYQSAVDSPTAPNWLDIQMRVTYTTIVDGKTKVESIVNKYSGETMVDQYNGAVDLNKMGVNMLGLSLKMGEPSLNCAHKICKWNDRIKVGDIYYYNDDLWVANVCSYTFLNGEYLQGKVTFIKNFNALSLRTQLLREKRISNISEALVNKSEDIYTDYVYYSSTSIDETSDSALVQFLAPYLYLSFYNDEAETAYGNVVALLRNIKKSKTYYIPLIKYGFGNTICFEMGFDSSISAGYKTQFLTGSSWFDPNKYFTEACNYTDDDYGFIDTCTVRIRDIESDYEWSTDFPEVPTMPSGNDIFVLSNYNVKKQPNEIFALNYNLTFLPIAHNIDFIGTAFINNNFFTNGRKERKLYIYYSTDQSFKYSVLDQKGEGERVDVVGVNFSVSFADQITITFEHNLIDEDNIYSWAVCDEDGNILFATNTEVDGPSDEKQIFMIITHDRIPNDKLYKGIKIL